MQVYSKISIYNFIKAGLFTVIFAIGFSSRADIQCRTLFEVPKSVTDSIGYTTQESITTRLNSFKVLIQEVKKDDLFKQMLLDFNEKEKGITIETHVFDVYNQYLLESQGLSLIPQLMRVLPLAIALHDIGKPLAIERGRRDLQHDYTIPMMRKYLTEKKWPKADINLAIALVSYSGLGDLAKKKKIAKVVAEELRILSESLKISVIDFYMAKKAFYFSDAGAYSQLRELVFNELPDGRLEPKSERFLELEELLFE